MNLCTTPGGAEGAEADYGEVYQALPLLGRLLLTCHDKEVVRHCHYQLLVYAARS